MKKFTFLLITLCLATAVFAQQSRLKVQQSIQNVKLPTPTSVKNFSPVNMGNVLVSSKSAMEDVLGNTFYDLQTNASMATRIHYFDDGTMAGTWTRGITSGFPDRGTGYNYFDGSAWGPEPTARIEDIRCGWPSYAPLGANGEIVVSHTDLVGLKVATRATKGTGAWTLSVLGGPAGAVDISWPRVTTSGTAHNYVHVIATTYSGYQGLDESYALLYYRSMDGGVTWDKKHIILPGMTSADYLGFSGDDYAWGTSHGDTIYFVVAGNWVDGFIMKSNDNGETWTKSVFFENGAKMNASTNYFPPFYCLDGSVQVELDNHGVYHVVVGRMRATDDGSGRKYYPGTDGLIYWNSTMPMLPDSLDLDTLDAHGQLIGYVAANTAGDSIVGLPAYGVGLSSFPQLTLDNDAIYIIWSSLTVGNPSPDNFNYRHIWVRGSVNNGNTWGPMVDVNEGLIYIYKEYVFPSMTKKSTPNQIHYLYQTADIPGSAIKETTIPIHENFIEYRALDKAVLVGLNDNKQTIRSLEATNRPNPFTGTTTLDVSTSAPGTLLLNVFNATGQQVLTLNKGRVNAGITSFTIDGSRLSSGVYFYTVSVGNERFTGKMIVK